MGTLYAVGSRLFEAGFRAWNVDLRVSGVENLPATGPAVVASNHISYLDFAFVMLAPPRPRREMRFLARSEFFENPVVGGLMRRLGQIPVDVHGDPIAAAAAARAALTSGEMIGVHPEGTISPSYTIRRAKTGAVRLAEDVGAPIIPTVIWGSQRLLTKWRPVRPPRRGIAVSVHYGAPFEPQGRTGMARTRSLMDQIGALLADVQAAYPQQPAPGDDWWLPRHLGGGALDPQEAERRLEEQAARRRSGNDAPR